MNLRIYFLLITILLTVSCTKQLVPSEITEKKNTGFDPAEFEYMYVEAIKQKHLGNYGEAMKYFDQCLKLNPGSDASYYQMGQILATGGDLANAKKYVHKAISIDNRNLWYLVSLSGMYHQEKKIDSALIYYEKAVKYFPDNETIQLTLGNLYIDAKKFDKANSIFDSFDKKYGINESSTLLSVKSLMAAGSFAEALVKAEALLKQDPDEPLYNGLLAEILRGTGEKEKALDVYKKLIERNPDNGNVQMSLIDFLLSEKRYENVFLLLNSAVLNNNIGRDEKIALFAKLIEIPELIDDNEGKLTLSLMILEANYKEDDIIPLIRPDLLIKQNRLNDAAVRLEEMIRMKPSNYYAWEKLLLVYLELGDFVKLTQRGAECSKKFNMSFVAKVLYANGAVETGKFDIALEELKKAEILAGENMDFKVQVLTMRADIYYRMKDYPKAFETFEEALKSNSEDLTVLNNYAYYLAEQNMKLKEAEALARKIVEKEKGNTTFMDTYGWVLYKRGKLKEAARVMESVINSGNKPDAEWFEHYGYILHKQNKCAKAVESWKTAIKLDSKKTNLIKEIENCQD